MLSLKNINQNYVQGDSIIKVLSQLNFSVNGIQNIGIIGPSGLENLLFSIFLV